MEVSIFYGKEAKPPATEPFYGSGRDGEARRIETEHIIAATGYRTDIRRLPFLSVGITLQLKLFDNVPETVAAQC
jgi:hypothetical protein